MKQQATNILASQDNQCTCMYHYVSVSRYVTAPYAPLSYEAKQRKVLKYNTSGLFFLSNTTPKSSGITQLALAYPLDFSEPKKVQRFRFIFADFQHFT